MSLNTEEGYIHLDEIELERGSTTYWHHGQAQERVLQSEIVQDNGPKRRH